MPTAPSWHSIAETKALDILKVSSKFGLNNAEVQKRQKEYGFNKLAEDKSTPRIVLFLRQFKSPLVFILVIAGGVTFWLQEYQNSFVIFGAALLVTAIGYVQENKASQALLQLKRVLKQTAFVIREGTEKRVLQEELVPGDIVILTEGNKVPADVRILESFELRVNEAVLTGEWLASAKKEGVLARSTPLADRDNMAYMGSIVEAGRGEALVVETGEKTEIGRISQLLSEVKEEKTPYQKKLGRFSWIIGGIIAALASFVFIEGVARGGEIVDMFTIAVAVAVAAIPEGLPVAMTVVLAIGMQRILSKNGLVRHLTSAETLGSTSIIATDKTLTLTEGRMSVAELVPFLQGKKEELLVGATLANEAFVENPGAGMKETILRGRPTDKALLEAGMESGIVKKELEKNQPLLFRAPFNSQKKYIASFHALEENVKAYVSGAPERILELSLLSQSEYEQAKKRVEELTSKGLRVVALGTKDIAKKRGGSKSRKELLQEVRGLTLLGFIALKDPIRKGVKEAMQLAASAGLRTIIVTGDHLLTAKAVAKELSMPMNKDSFMEGKELETLSDRQLDLKLERIVIFARVEPKHKLRIIEAWQRKGQVIAMTGDGVNDAPALKKADIGLALGSGTDVAKEASDVILLQDDFAIIPSAIREGRVIIDNIRKVITYLVSGSFTETVLIGGSLVLGLPLPLTALQILWINLITDGLPGMALTTERPEDNVMKRPPLKKNAPLLTQEMKVIILGIGIPTDFLLFGLFLWLLQGSYTIEHVQTAVFVGLGISTMFYAFSVRNFSKNIWRYNPFSNLWLTGTVVLGFFLMAATVYVPFLQNLLGTVPLTSLVWGPLFTI